jgi:hypothetical protein
LSLQETLRVAEASGEEQPESAMRSQLRTDEC